MTGSAKNLDLEAILNRMHLRPFSRQYSGENTGGGVKQT